METRTYKVYKFNELTEEGKEKAINRFREINDLSFTWETTQEDAKQIGLKLDGVDRSYMRGSFINSAEDCMDSIIKNHGKKCETYKTAKQYRKELRQAKTEDDKDNVKEEFLKSIMEDYRIMQEKEEEYQQSDEAIIETIEANDYMFTEDGRID